MTVLLSGATGFLGSHLLKRFVKEGIEVVALKRSTSNTYRVADQLDNINLYDIDIISIEDIFKKHNVDIVINTVTDYGRTTKKISTILETNLMFSLRLLEGAIANDVKTFINTNTLLDKEINAYALSKNQFVQWMHFLSNAINMVDIKIEHMYGPMDDENKFIYWFIKQLESNVKKIDLTSGTQKRDFIYINDIVEAYMSIIDNLDKFSSFEEFELGSGNAVEVKKVLEIIYEQMKQRQSLSTKLNFGAVAYREKENMCMEANISKLKSLGWTPTTDIQNGIKNIIEGETHD